MGFNSGFKGLNYLIFKPFVFTTLIFVKFSTMLLERNSYVNFLSGMKACNYY